MTIKSRYSEETEKRIYDYYFKQKAKEQMSNYYEPKNNDSMYLGGESDWKQMWPKSVLPGPVEYDEINGLPRFEDVFYSTGHSKLRDHAWKESIAAAEKAIERQVGGSHYKDKGSSMQPWAIIDAWGLDFYGGNVLKYILRAKHKGGLEDLQKARHYLDKMIEDADAS